MDPRIVHQHGQVEQAVVFFVRLLQVSLNVILKLSNFVIALELLLLLLVIVVVARLIPRSRWFGLERAAC